MKYRAEVKTEDKTAKLTYDSNHKFIRRVNENGFVNKAILEESDFLNQVKRFESKAQQEGYYFRVDRFLDNKWITYLEVEH